MSQYIFRDAESGKHYTIAPTIREKDGPIPKDSVVLIVPLPHPPTKHLYWVEMNQVGGDYIISQKLDLTSVQGEAVAKAIEALLTYVRAENKYLSNGELISNYTEDMIQARKAYQDGSAA